MAWFIDADKLLADIETLKMSEWYEFGKNPDHPIAHCWYLSRADAVNKVRELCVKPQNVVDAEPVRHGRWVKMTGMMPPEYHGHYECSVCQWHMKGIRASWTREEEMSYCPRCGAKMDGGET